MVSPKKLAFDQQMSSSKPRKFVTAEISDYSEEQKVTEQYKNCRLAPVTIDLGLVVTLQ
jgi:hypothetical protein